MAGEQGKRQPPFSLPKGIVLLATPDGWRHSVLTGEGGTVCGHLGGESLDPEAARTAATTLLNTRVEVTWDPGQEPGTWTGQVTPLPDDGTGPARGGG